MRSEFEDPVDRCREGEPATTPLPRMETYQPWDYRPDAGWAPDVDLSGYHVEALDGTVGKVSQAANAPHGSYLAVDTGPWIFGRTVVIPAGIVTNFDHVSRRVYLDRSKEQIKSAPDYSDETAYWDKLAAHYGRS